MTGEQWFDIWLALGQTAIGAAVTVLAVYLAAMAAFRHDSRRAVAERSRAAAEQILAVTEVLQQRLLMTYGHVNFVFEPTPERVDDPRLTQDFVISDVAQAAAEDLARMKMEAGLLEEGELRQQFDWASKCAIDFHLMVVAAMHQPERFTAKEIAENAGQAATFLGHFGAALRAYLMNIERPVVPKPTHLRTPVKEDL